MPETLQTLPPLTLPPISRLTLALYCGASGDHNPIHVDLDFARSAGLQDVFAHGMLSMAYLGRLVTNWRPQSQLQTLKARFLAVVAVGDVLTLHGEVIERLQESGRPLLRVTLSAVRQNGDTVLTGEAIVRDELAG
ncbi:MAG TPA: MaoC family dehydratase [Steroidobacteraceae bacterium]|nr:MaoC family dehydratase [Steroidobacteraceae bacterium]